jgi:hypothetical protein
MFTNDQYIQLMNDEALRDRNVTTGKTKVLRIALHETPIRIKVTPSQSIAVRDNDEAFVKALFPSHYEEYSARRSDKSLKECVAFMRMRMELRREVMRSALIDPRQTLIDLKREHKNF